jgi:hypothetical protein
VLTALGTVLLRRVYFVCHSCHTGEHPADKRFGVNGFISIQARRLLCLAGGSWSFDCAARHLKEFCGLVVADNTIRSACQEEGGEMARWQREAREAVEPFRETAGDIEFCTDGTSVNTWEGWREMRLGIFSKRMRGESATVEQWEDRELPSPHVRVAFAAIEKSDRFGARWNAWRERLGIRDTSQISVLADGATWIWEEAALNFAGATGVLDIYHGLEHLSDTSKLLYGEGTVESKRWAEDGCHALLSGWDRLDAHLTDTERTVRRPAARKNLRGLRQYFGKHPEHLCYSQRLSEGRSIGSGQVEGACKHMIGRRLKQTGARWRVRRVNRMATVCCLMYSDHWDTYWATLQN